MWNLPPPPGFQGFREDLPVTFYGRHLPHWRQIGATYFATFRLADSLPQTKLDDLARLKRKWEQENPPPRSSNVLEAWARMAFERVEYWLDQGFGECVLGEDECAEKVIESLHHFDNEFYELDCYVVMPNHAHAILRPLKSQIKDLEGILKSWKSFQRAVSTQFLSKRAPYGRTKVMIGSFAMRSICGERFNTSVAIWTR